MKLRHMIQQKHVVVAQWCHVTPWSTCHVATLHCIKKNNNMQNTDLDEAFFTRPLLTRFAKKKSVQLVCMLTVISLSFFICLCECGVWRIILLNESRKRYFQVCALELLHHGTKKPLHSQSKLALAFVYIPLLTLKLKPQRLLPRQMECLIIVCRVGLNNETSHHCASLNSSQN